MSHVGNKRLFCCYHANYDFMIVLFEIEREGGLEKFEDGTKAVERRDVGERCREGETKRENSYRWVPSHEPPQG